jgi:iron only hydrogenase large subunit-like protein
MTDQSAGSLKRFHSVVLDEDACKGCTICVTTCPAEAIRVRNGKARILAERCIDCGECIRRCPNHAKKARVDELAALSDPERFGAFDWKIALPAPSLYGQFPERYTIANIHAALRAIGFDEVFPVARATPFIAGATREMLDREKYPELPRPLISSSCPTIIKLIQIRFPTLIRHVVPIIAPMELAGRMAKTIAREDLAARATGTSGGKPPRIGCFFITPCAGKITEAVAPLDQSESSIDGVFSVNDLHIPLLTALIKLPKDGTEGDESTAAEISWGRAGGEAETTITTGNIAWLSVDGMDHCLKILEEAEDGNLKGIEFLELMACTDGCVGGPLSVENPSIARHTIREREKKIAAKKTASPDETGGNESDAGQDRNPTYYCHTASPLLPRPSLLLDPDFKKAMGMMERMEEINEGLPGLDCGCCGAPNCHALAEDIVRGNANRTDCVIILKEQYRELVERNGRRDGKK